MGFRELMTDTDKCYFSNDQLAKWMLVGRKWYFFLLIPLIMIILSAVGLIVFGWRMGYLYTTNDFIGSLDYVGELFIQGLALPILVAYYFTVPALVNNVFAELRTNKVIDVHRIPDSLHKLG